jgi:hypothetical protein
MFGPLKNAHNASKFATKLGLACEWLDDPKVPIWISEAYTCFKKVRAGGGEQICWNTEDAEKFALQLRKLAPIVHDEVIASLVSEMLQYFRARSLEGYYLANRNEGLLWKFVIEIRPDLHELAPGVAKITFEALRQLEMMDNPEAQQQGKVSLAKVATILGAESFFQVIDMADRINEEDSKVG